MKITEMYLTPNEFSRPQIPLKSVTKIAVHYVGNPMSTAKNNRDYFENLRFQKKGAKGNRYVSSHFIIGLSGEIIQCIPLDEWSYCTNQANGYSISIECCHPDGTGRFTDATEKSLAELCAYLCRELGLDPARDIIRHYDVTGKQCPLYWSPTKYTSAATADARFNAFRTRVKYTMDCGEAADTVSDNALPDVPFMIRVIDPALNIRNGPGVNHKAVGIIKKSNVKYTIIEISQVGSSLWGKLKSGAGWINVGEKYCRKV